MVCYKAEELSSRYDAKLQHVFLMFLLVYFCKKCEIWAWERRKFCGNKTSISCWTCGIFTIHIRQGSV